MSYTIDTQLQSIYPSIPKDLLSTYYVLGCGLGTEDIAMNEEIASANILMGRQTISQ